MLSQRGTTGFWAWRLVRGSLWKFHRRVGLGGASPLIASSAGLTPQPGAATAAAAGSTLAPNPSNRVQKGNGGCKWLTILA